MNRLIQVWLPELADLPADVATNRLQAARIATFRAKPGLWVLLLLISAAVGVSLLAVAWWIVPEALHGSLALRVLTVCLVPAGALVTWSALCAYAVRRSLNPVDRE